MVGRRTVGRVAVRVLAALAVCATMFPVAGAQAAATGAVSQITWGIPRADVDREVAMLRDSGARYIRANVNWGALQPNGPGGLDAGALAMYDYAIDKARAAGLEVVMPVSDGVPYWASADPAKHIDGNGRRQWTNHYPPSDMADYAAVFRQVVERYAPRGVHIYEVWNEPNIASFWATGPDPARYADMLKAAYPAIKAADPKSTVLLGGLSRNDFSYLEGVYRAGGGGSFDAVAVHPYTYGVDPTVSWKGVNAGEDRNRLSWNSFPALKEIRHSMDSFGDTAKPVWITEFGWSSSSGDGGVSEAQQAEMFTKAHKYVEQFPWVKAMLWYAARNSPWSNDADDYYSQFGLATTAWRLKPVGAAMRAYAKSTGSMPAPGTPAPGTAAPANAAPTVRLTRPGSGARFTSSLSLAADARDDRGVTRVEFLVDGRVVATDRTAPFTASWRASSKVAKGAHRVSAKAYDASGRSATHSVTVTRAASGAARTAAAPTVVRKRATRRAVRTVIRGRVPASVASARRVVVELQRQAPDRSWRAARRATARVVGRTYSAAVRAGAGAWRVRVVAARRGAPDWSSPYRSFRVRFASAAQR